MPVIYVCTDFKINCDEQYTPEPTPRKNVYACAVTSRGFAHGALKLTTVRSILVSRWIKKILNKEEIAALP